MKLTLLGTGTSQGVPVIGCACEVCLSNNSKDVRLRTAALVQSAEANIVIDVGPDFRMQLLANPIDRLDAILLTHEHNDHVIGLDEIRPFNFRQKEAIPIYGMSRTLQELEKRFEYAFQVNQYPGSPKVKPITITSSSNFTINDLQIQSIRVEHGKLEILGYVFNDRVGYLTDVKTIHSSEMEKLFKLDLLVINALRKEEHHSHLTLEQAIALIQSLTPKKAVITHISHQMGLNEIIQNELPANVLLGYDGYCWDENS